jgi:hypothetical protein
VIPTYSIFQHVSIIYSIFFRPNHILTVELHRSFIYIVYWNVYTMDLIPMDISSGSPNFRLLAYRRQLSQKRAVWTKIDIYVLLAILYSCKVLDVCLLNNIIMWLLWFSWTIKVKIKPTKVEVIKLYQLFVFNS